MLGSNIVVDVAAYAKSPLRAFVRSAAFCYRYAENRGLTTVVQAAGLAKDAAIGMLVTTMQWAVIGARRR